ncbi:hypothetical protein [Saccharothrix variisporea]|uniref:Uncharacterized protein n=1 Tax=Saccharothrix variisporea TaxID=543527 RepID=A0A495X7R0_9PSEU|nr:hypothetical protein [Saccharothrix variisporea]RKT67558.1 hypothetical protein DFJ66_0733 [Saccharothrix variisporea]
MQAKRSLRKKGALDKAVRQWVAAGKAGVTPSRDRLVIVTAELSGPARALAAVLERNRLALPGAPTAAEAEISVTSSTCWSSSTLGAVAGLSRKRPPKRSWTPGENRVDGCSPH